MLFHYAILYIKLLSFLFLCCCLINVFEASDIFRELHCSYLGQPLQTLVLGSENKLNYEHLRIFLIHTGNKIALQFHKINVPVYIYRKTDCTYPQRSIRKNERERLRERIEERKCETKTEKRHKNHTGNTVLS